MARMTKAEKAAELKVEMIYRKSCSGVQIPMMSIGSIFAAGKAAIAAGGDDAAVTAAILKVVDAVKVA